MSIAFSTAVKRPARIHVVPISCSGINKEQSPFVLSLSLSLSVVHAWRESHLDTGCVSYIMYDTCSFCSSLYSCSLCQLLSDPSMSLLCSIHSRSDSNDVCPHTKLLTWNSALNNTMAETGLRHYHAVICTDCRTRSKRSVPK